MLYSMAPPLFEKLKEFCPLYDIKTGKSLDYDTGPTHP